ncbi:MAG: hypothetical protein JXR03_15715 [Cyclobacteriaceae bacterium]
MKKQTQFILLLIAFVVSSCSSDGGNVSPSSGGESVGTGGSLARFTISGDYLYAVDQTQLLTFSLLDPLQPVKVDLFELDWGVETIFTMDTIVFVGTQTGMHMFDISEGSRPGYLSLYEHIQSCDPVVAQDTLAFVTLRSGNTCWNGENQLDVIDIRDLRDPKLITSYPMQNPYGLGIAGNHLFVCEGKFGLKVFEIKAGGELSLVKFYSSIRSQDVILKENNLMIIVAEDGLFQYDYSDVRNIELLSQIKIEY